jgi:hypothetical protein
MSPTAVRLLIAGGGVVSRTGVGVGEIGTVVLVGVDVVVGSGCELPLQPVNRDIIIIIVIKYSIFLYLFKEDSLLPLQVGCLGF